MALAPRLTKAGDECCIVLGANVPCVLRPRDDGYSLLGEAYVHGYMLGEVKDQLDVGYVTVEGIVLH
jgi:hypothetical protein